MKKLSVLILTLFTVSAKAQLLPLKDFIDTWIGKPYRFGGTTIKGIDCSAFVQKLYSTVYDLAIPRTAYYQFKETQRIEKDSIRIGDLIFFTSRLSPSGWHVGVYLGENQFVHAANRRDGVKISSLLEPFYSKNFKGAGRPKSTL